ncbi:protealysin inhibitor emfourin [Actinomadura macrotermitis]|uniref:Uncharacterized protein n=1 Tax=Actinomadura macrotermitis TaxID=2585200 RepID=A0A7K0C243_9ACTN|nr:protealysin inhibitor emfourin [Actinomadura macrotermitis]MQY07460.1 hypothetical protein [Actinomadura macrotermitis]
MRVKIESTGGFAGGENMVAVYDTADLPGDQAGRIEQAVSALAGTDACAEAGETGGDGDAAGYRITVEDDGRDPRVFAVPADPGEDIDGPITTLLQGPVEPEERPEDEGRQQAPPSPSGL